MSDTLRCTKCQRDLPDDDFSMDRKPSCRKRGFRRWNCRECHGRWNAGRRFRNRKLIQGVKDVPCMDCGKRYDFWIMQFDHVRGEKLFDLSQASGRAIQKVKDEIAKCDIVCSNCHDDRTYKRGLEALERGETVGCIVPRGTRLSPKTQTSSAPALPF